MIFIYSIYIEGARAGWILVADHPSACHHPVPAVLWSFYHSASGEGCPHRSCLIHTHTGMSLKNTALFLPSLINIVIELMQRLFRHNLFFSWDFFQAFFGFVALREMVRHTQSQFHLRQFEFWHLCFKLDQAFLQEGLCSFCILKLHQHFLIFLWLKAGI